MDCDGNRESEEEEEEEEAGCRSNNFASKREQTLIFTKRIEVKRDAAFGFESFLLCNARARTHVRVDNCEGRGIIVKSLSRLEGMSRQEDDFDSSIM